MVNSTKLHDSWCKSKKIDKSGLVLTLKVSAGRLGNVKRRLQSEQTIVKSAEIHPIAISIVLCIEFHVKMYLAYVTHRTQ
jgi:hypothetical protein